MRNLKPTFVVALMTTLFGCVEPNGKSVIDQGPEPRPERLVVSPGEITVVTSRPYADKRYAFTAQIQGSDNNAVVWSVASDPDRLETGEIDQEGRYLPPNRPGNDGIDRVLATWAVDGSVTASATVNLLARDVILDISVHCVGVALLIDQPTTDEARLAGIEEAKQNGHDHLFTGDARDLSFPQGAQAKRPSIAVYVELNNPTPAELELYRDYGVRQCDTCIFSQDMLADSGWSDVPSGISSYSRYWSQSELAL